MYIEDRLFSGEEQDTYYSVVLDETEMRLYSEFQKEFTKSVGILGHIKYKLAKRKVNRGKEQMEQLKREFDKSVEEIKKKKFPKKKDLEEALDKKIQQAKDTLKAFNDEKVPNSNEKKIRAVEVLDKAKKEKENFVYKTPKEQIEVLKKEARREYRKKQKELHKSLPGELDSIRNMIGLGSNSVNNVKDILKKAGDLNHVVTGLAGTGIAGTAYKAYKKHAAKKAEEKTNKMIKRGLLGAAGVGGGLVGLTALNKARKNNGDGYKDGNYNY